MQLSMNFEPFCAKLGNILLKIVTYFTNRLWMFVTYIRQYSVESIAFTVLNYVRTYLIHLIREKFL